MSLIESISIREKVHEVHFSCRLCLFVIHQDLLFAQTPYFSPKVLDKYELCKPKDKRENLLLTYALIFFLQYAMVFFNPSSKETFASHPRTFFAFVESRDK